VCASDQPRRRWFRYSLRTLFVVMVLVGACCWVGIQLKWKWDRDKAVVNGNVLVIGRWNAPWSIQLFGAQGYQMVVIPIIVLEPDGQSDVWLKSVAEMFPEASVSYFQESPTGQPYE